MRFLLLTVLVAACGTDTFETSDGGDAAQGDAASDGAMPDAAPFDPSQLGSLVLWLDAHDAQTQGGDAADLVTAWPDHLKKYQTEINIGLSTQGCAPGLHASAEPALNGKPVVTFCASNLAVKDTNALRLGTNGFYIAAVMSPAPSAVDNVLFTKTSPGQSQMPLAGLTLLANNASGRLQGWLDSTSSATSQNQLGSNYFYVAFVRTNGNTGSQISVHVNGVVSPTTMVNSTDDVSASGADIGIGGYKFDQGDVRHLFGGSLAELVVASAPDTLGLVETYFKKKYGL